MNLEVHNEYKTHITKIINALEKNSSRHPDILHNLQAQLDELAKKYQHDEDLGKERYLLYHAQALIKYREDNLEEAIRWIEDAIDVKGERYEFADWFIENIRKESGTSSMAYPPQRIGRLSYVFSLLLGYAMLLGFAVIVGILAGFFGWSTDDGSAAIVLLYVISIPLLVYYSVRAAVLRLHDLDMSGWWILGSMIPFVNIYLAIKLLFFRGDVQDNKYGPKVSGNRVASFY